MKLRLTLFDCGAQVALVIEGFGRRHAFRLGRNPLWKEGRYGHAGRSRRAQGGCDG